MKIPRYIVCTFLYLILSSALSAEIAVLPYRVENPSEYFKPEAGDEYAKLLGVALALKKGVEIYSPRDLESDMKSFSISPRETITREQLEAFGKGRYVDLVIAGSLEKRGASYIAESTLYSVVQQRVVAKSRIREGSLFACAEKEAGELLFDQPDKMQGARSGSGIDLTVIFDASFNVEREWDALKRGIAGLASGVSDGWELPVRVYLVPYSDAHAPAQVIKPVQSPASLRAELDKLKLKGGSGGDAFTRAMNFAMRTIPWRKGAGKILVAVSNSPLKKAAYVERHALAARKKNITVYAVSLGKQTREDADLMRQLTRIGKGRFYSAAYRQRVYDVSGKGTDLFMESGRLFRAGSYGRQWKDGLFQRSADGKERQARPKPFLSEIDFDERRHELTPYSMAKVFPDIADVAIINSEGLENNADELLENLGETYYKTAGRKSSGTSIARVLLSDQHISLWVRVHSPEDLEYFTRQESAGHYFPLGVTVQKKSDEAYGITFSPGSYVTRIKKEHIPVMASTALKEIIENSDHYTDNGLFRPPVWFVDVKVERIERTGVERDIRDMR